MIGYNTFITNSLKKVFSKLDQNYVISSIRKFTKFDTSNYFSGQNNVDMRVGLSSVDTVGYWKCSVSFFLDLW